MVDRDTFGPVTDKWLLALRNQLITVSCGLWGGRLCRAPTAAQDEQDQTQSPTRFVAE